MEQNNAVVETGWRRARLAPSLPENFQTIPVPSNGPWWRTMLAIAGPGYLVAVGYMDPGNWATALAGGSQFGYSLLFVILLSNCMAMVLQALAGKLGIVTGRDLAQACRDHYSAPITYILWVLCEIAICACDLAEVIGSALALKLLFNIPLIYGVCFTVLDVFIILYFQKKHFRFIELFVITLTLIIAVCFCYEILFSQPNLSEVVAGLIPHQDLIYNRDMLYIGIGIIGATVMPHNLYLHSSIVQTRKYSEDSVSKAHAIKFITIDSTIALMGAFFINAAILIIAAAVFHHNGHFGVVEIEEAYKLLSPLLDTPLASTLFALALLASGQNSTVTGTLAGQIVMEGFLTITCKPWLRRLLTRSLAIIPAIICIMFFGETSIAQLLLLSQVVLSFQLAFAIIPLIIFTSDKQKMGEFANSPIIKLLAWLSALLIISLNIKFLLDKILIT